MSLVSAEIAVCAWYVFYPTNVSLLNMFLPTSGLSELLDCEVPLEVCLSTVKLLVEEKRYDLSSLLIGTKIVFLKSVVEKARHMCCFREALAFDFLKRVCQHFESSPELGSALLMHIELLLQRDKELLAKQKIEDAIMGHFHSVLVTENVFRVNIELCV